MQKIIALACAALVAGTAAAAPGIPRGFLLYEKAAATKDSDPETVWKVSDSLKSRFALNPCGKNAPGGIGRVAARTVTFTGVPDFMKVEQVLLYGSRAGAERAMAQVRAALSACGAKKDGGSAYRYVSTAVAGLGDDALKVSGQVYYGRKAGVGGDRSVVVRRGNAVLVYLWAGEYSKPTKRDWADQMRDATKMTAKVCAIATCP
ncbi:hypothetical protein FHR32_005672 [Streptosporangium album]|uniref:PknH-like extracellular domain-containing protein n=1 Tax=Streptosporangium album TaxID=47479 RepID=A0A7W7WCG4_9ACTN|nr:hypothetical protein [Streptosporangium album]MBB4941295.1 hypothetical protein [Streptosporangium album]